MDSKAVRSGRNLLMMFCRWFCSLVVWLECAELMSVGGSDSIGVEV